MKKIKKDARGLVGFSMTMGIGAGMASAVSSPVSLTPMTRFVPAITALTIGSHLIRKTKSLTKKKKRKVK